MSDTKFVFDPEWTRSNLAGPTGVEYGLTADRDEMFRAKALHGVAKSMISRAVECFLVGDIAPAASLLAKAEEWIALAIETKEIPNHYFRGATEGARYDDLSLCRWLGAGRHDIDNLKSAVKFNWWYYEHYSKDRGGVQLTLPMYIDAEAYDEAIKLYEACKLKPPESASRARSEGMVAYAIAAQRLRQASRADEVREAQERLFKREVRQWLGHGHYTRAARWMKIAFWRPGESAAHAILRCYDYLPGLSPPTVS